MSCAINSCCRCNLMYDCYAYLLLNSAVELCPDTSLTFPLQVSKCACLPAVNIKSILLQCLRGCKASSLQSRAHSIPDKGSAFITWCSESQMRVRPCSAIYHPRSASSHRGRKDLGCVYAPPPPPRHLFLKSTRFSVTTVCCILCWENKHQHGGFADALRGLWLELLRPNMLHLVQNARSEVKTDDNDECGKRGQRRVKWVLI